MNYQAERDCFAFFKKNISDEGLKEYEAAIRDLHTRYNTTIYENRFIAGGAVKVFTYALLRASGVRVGMCEHGVTDGKLILPNNKNLSVKSTFGEDSSDIKLINTRGQNETNWNVATLFIIAGKGILYADPDMVQESDLERAKDGLTIPGAVLDKLAKRSNYLIEADISYKQPTEKAKFNHRASMAVAQKIMSDNKMSTLLKQMKNSYHEWAIETPFFKFSYSYSYRSPLKIINSIINQDRDKSPPR